jgi:peptidylprolyl isomerase
MTPTENRKGPKHKSGNKLWVAIGIIAIVIIFIGLYSVISQPGNENSAGSTKVLLHTSMGDITLELRNDMPITAGNFRNLVQSGTYNGTIFHRVIAGFMIQGGDPTGTGYGDPSIPNIKDEFTSDNHNVRGTIAMANTGQPNSGSSQFFINVVDNNNRYASFDSSYPVFGKVISGMDVVDKIAAVPTDSNDKPVQTVTIISATILT